MFTEYYRKGGSEKTNLSYFHNARIEYKNLIMEIATAYRFTIQFQTRKH